MRTRWVRCAEHRVPRRIHQRSPGSHELVAELFHVEASGRRESGEGTMVVVEVRLELAGLEAEADW